MTAAFIFGQDIDLSLEFRVRMNGARFSQDLAAFDIFTVDAAEQGTDVVACFSEVEDLTEHFNARNDRIFRFIGEADNFDRVTDFNRTAFDTTCSNGAAACNGEDVFDRHQERLVCRTLRSRNVAVDGIHQVEDGFFSFRIAFEGFQCRTYDDRNFIARIIIFSQEVTDFHFNEFNQFRVVDLVSFVEVYDDSRYADLTGQQDVFTSLRHRAVSCGYNEDSTIHLSSTGDHVLDIVSMPRAVNMCIVAFFRFIFDVRRIDRNTTFTFFRCLVNIGVIFELGKALLC